MANLALDTHEFINDLTAAGMKVDQAEVLVKHLKKYSLGADLVTKTDLDLAISKLWIRMLTTQVALTVALAGIVVAANFN